MMLWKLAWRSVWRNKRRTFVTAATLTVGITVMAMASGLGGGMADRMVVNATNSRLGEAQIHAREYRETQDETLVIDNTDELVERARNLSGVTAAAPRTMAQGVLSIADRSRGVQVFGIEPTAEKKTTNWHERIVDGEYVDEPGEVMLGGYIAEKLEVEVGSKMVITAANIVTGEATRELVRVVGILSTGDVATDRQAAIVHIDMAQKMFGTVGKAHEIALRLDVEPTDRDRIEEVIAPLESDELEVEPWQEITPLVGEMHELMSTYMAVALFAIFFILAFGIINTLTMSLLERTREFGVMRAIGTSGKALAGQIVAEAFCLGLVGAIPGIVLGTAMSYYLAVVGYDFSGTTAYGMEFSDPIYGEFDVASIVLYAAAFTALTALISLSSAIRAARLEPVEAMRN